MPKVEVLFWAARDANAVDGCWAAEPNPKLPESGVGFCPNVYCVGVEEPKVAAPPNTGAWPKPDLDISYTVPILPNIGEVPKLKLLD